MVGHMRVNPQYKLSNHLNLEAQVIYINKQCEHYGKIRSDSKEKSVPSYHIF